MPESTVAPASDVIKHWMTKVLIEQCTSLHSFRIASSHVTARGLKKVGEAIRDGQIQVYLSPHSGCSCPRYIGDNNNPALNGLSNFFVLPDRAKKADYQELKCVVVHEAVHALNDIEGITISTIDDEAAAYIAEVVFALTNNLPTHWTTGKPILEAALPAAQAIRAGNNHALHKAMPELRRAVRHGYAKKTTHYDGVPGIAK